MKPTPINKSPPKKIEMRHLQSNTDDTSDDEVNRAKRLAEIGNGGIERSLLFTTTLSKYRYHHILGLSFQCAVNWV